MRESRPTRQSQGRPNYHEMLTKLGRNNQSVDVGPDHVAAWVRYRKGGEDDLTNVSRKIQEGYDVVMASDLNKTTTSFLETKGEGRLAGAVIKGDLMLMRMPKDLAEARREYKLEKAKNLVEAQAKQRQAIAEESGSFQIKQGKELDPTAGVTETIGSEALKRKLSF